jgi:hypothetical protein
MPNINKKLSKLCKKIEKEYEGKVVLEKSFTGEENITIPVSIKKPIIKDTHQSLYGEPIGLIEIVDKKVRFIPLDKHKAKIKLFFKIVIIVLTIFGLKKYFSSEKRWDSEG